MRKLKLSNANKRDAEVTFGGIIDKPQIKYVLANGENYQTVKILKSPLQNQYDSLLKKFETDENLTKALIQYDPEIDLELSGQFVKGAQKVLMDEEMMPVFKAKIMEVVYNPDGTIKEERIKANKESNIFSTPISWTGKHFLISEIYNKFILGKKYQITHTNGLTFDFLFQMAKELHDKQAMMLLAGGVKGNEPLVFQDNGKPYRAFLEGRVKDKSYLLLLHLSNLELKPIIA